MIAGQAQQTNEAVAAEDWPVAVEAPSDEAENAAWQGRHAVNLRLTLPFFRGRYYLTILGGKERRGDGRLAEERRKYPIATPGNIALLTLLGAATGLALLTIFQVVTSFWMQRMGILLTNQ